MWWWLGCQVVEIPVDLDGVVHHAWQIHEDGADEELAGTLVALDAAVGGATLAEAFDGTLSRLSAEQVAPLGVTDRDPALAAGIFLQNVMTCDLDAVVAILTWPDQAELYTDAYDAYVRAFVGDSEAFLAGGVDTLAWEADYETRVLGSSYTSHTVASLRRVPAEELEGTGITAAYAARYFAPEPAVFEEGSGKTFDQDYQYEVYWSRDPGLTLHAYAMWRQADWGAGLTSDDEAVQRLVLNGMADWDTDTEAICAAGGPSVNRARAPR